MNVYFNIVTYMTTKSIVLLFIILYNVHRSYDPYCITGEFMNELKSYREVMAQQDEVRKKLIYIRSKNLLTWDALAREIGISHVTLRKFIVDEINMRFIILNKICNYITRYESKNELN